MKLLILNLFFKIFNLFFNSKFIYSTFFYFHFELNDFLYQPFVFIFCIMQAATLMLVEHWQVVCWNLKSNVFFYDVFIQMHLCRLIDLLNIPKVSLHNFDCRHFLYFWGIIVHYNGHITKGYRFKKRCCFIIFTFKGEALVHGKIFLQIW